MTNKQLDSIYCGLCDLLESCTPKEMEHHRGAILQIKSLILSKMRKLKIKKIMANEKTIKAVANFLTRCFTGDMTAITNIACAYVDCLDGKAEGKETLIEALRDVQEFCGDLITAIEKDDAN